MWMLALYALLVVRYRAVFIKKNMWDESIRSRDVGQVPFSRITGPWTWLVIWTH